MAMRERRRHPLRLAVAGILAALLLVELGVRVATGSLFTLRSKESESYAVLDPVVGRIPRPGLSVRHPAGFHISTGEYGTRRNGEDPPPPAQPAILVVGDSFAFGDGVDDRDSWPAVLERRTGTRVVNAAVPGFGLDQAVLRAEQLAPIFQPAIIIVGFIPHDVLRGEMSYWSGHAKPYFDLDGERLRLHPAAVPSPLVAALKNALVWSRTIDLLFPQFYWDGPEAEVVHHRGREVACQLMGRLATLGQERGARIVVVAQPQRPTPAAEDLELKDGVLACASADHLPTLDLFPVFDALPLARREALLPRHFDAEGNALIAAQLDAFLRQFP